MAKKIAEHKIIAVEDDCERVRLHIVDYTPQFDEVFTIIITHNIKPNKYAISNYGIVAYRHNDEWRTRKRSIHKYDIDILKEKSDTCVIHNRDGYMTLLRKRVI